MATLTAPLSGNYLIFGDINLHHSRWQPSIERGPSYGAVQFVEWPNSVSLIFLSPPDKPTHNRGNVLDLAFGTSLTVNNVSYGNARHLAATSEHLPLIATLGWANPPVPQERLRPDTLDPTLFRQLLELGCRGLAPLPVSPSSEDLDNQAEVLVKIKYDTCCGAAKRTLGAGHGNPWWNDSCKEARKGYKLALWSPSNESGVCDAQKAYRKTVQIAKNNFFKTKFERAHTAKEIFGVTKWHKSAGTYRPRSLRDSRFPEQPPVQSLAGKMEVLMQDLLANPSVVGDIPMDSPTVSSTSLPFPSSTIEKIRDSILRAGNTSPDADGILTAIIRRAWPLIEQQVLSLFNACLSIEQHPECFRKAIQVMIQKPDKTDYSSPRSYRPIALLSVLGKGLERFITKNGLDCCPA